MHVLTIPIGVDYEAEISLRKDTVAILEELAGVGGNSVAGNGDVTEDAATYDGAVCIKT